MAFKFGEKLKKILAHAAPALGAAVGGPFGGLAGRALQEALGVDSEEAAMAAIESDPAALLKLREADKAFQTRMKELDIDLEKVNADDRNSARNRQVALKDNTPAMVLYLTTLGFYGTLGYLLIYGLPTNGGEALLLMIGALGSAWGASVSYFVGSSAGSTAKTAMLGK